MKFFPTLPVVLLAMVSPLAYAQEPFTYETAAILSSTGDFDGNGQRDAVIVDRLTGDVRIAFQQLGGNYLWSAPQPTGIEKPETLTVAKIFGVDWMMVGSTLANRVHAFISQGPGVTISPLPIYPTAPGPSSMTAMDINADGAMDLVTVGEGVAPFTGSQLGKGKALQGILNPTSSPANSWATAFPSITARVNPARPKTGIAPRICELYYSPGSSTATFYLEVVGSSGLSAGISTGGVTPATRYVPTSLDGGVLTQFLFWEPGGTTFQLRRITEATPNVFAFGTVANFTLPSAVETITPVPQGAVGRITVLFTNGTAAVYAFNGTAAPVLVQTLPGAGHEIILPMEAGAFLLGSNMRGSTPSWKRFSPSGGGYIESFGGTLEQAQGARSSNVLFLSSEPFVNVSAQPRKLTRFRDWTTFASPVSGTAWNVQSQGFSSAGLTAAQTTTLDSQNGTDFPMVNQYSPALSFYVLQASAGIDQVDVLFSPPPGTYPPPVADNIPSVIVNLAATANGFRIFYRRNAGAFIELATPGEISLASSSTIEAYAQSFSGVRSPMRKGIYTVTSPSALAPGAVIDLDLDGMADDWERAFALTNASADADGDYISNLSEYVAGTDPQNSASVPPSPLVLIASTIQNSGITYLRLEWTDATAILKKSIDFNNWGPHGAFILTTANGFQVNIPMTEGKAFYRLEK